MNENGPVRRWAGAQRETFLATIIDALPGTVAYWDAELLCRYANRAFFDWFGKTPESVLGTHYRELVDERFFRENEPYLRAALAGEKLCYERTVPKSDGSIRHLLVNYNPDIDPAGHVLGFFVFVNDITVVKNAEAQLEIGAAVFNHAADGIFVTDAEGTIVSVNPAFTEITGYSLADAVGKNPRFLKSDRQGPEFFRALWRELTTNGRWQGEIWNRRKNGETFMERQTITMIRNAAGQAVRFVSVFSDITEHWHKSERIRHLAYHDELTNLPNRSVFIDRLDDEIAIAERDAECLAVMFFDLDGFKAVNDRYGHGVGDTLLENVARTLQRLTRRTDMVARIGGDEFVALILNIRGEEPVERIAASMISAINVPLQVQGHLVRVGVSIGIAMYPTHGHQALALMQAADAAMYAAKALGKNTYCFARPASADRRATA